jgi:hypothetical protein
LTLLSIGSPTKRIANRKYAKSKRVHIAEYNNKHQPDLNLPLGIRFRDNRDEIDNVQLASAHTHPQP